MTRLNKDSIAFIESLKEQQNVIGIVLFGSWVRGNNRPDSDVDLLVILKEGYSRVVEYLNDQAFEMVCTTAGDAIKYWESHKDDCAGLWEVAQILYDEEGVVEKLKADAKKMLAEGKQPIDTYQAGQFRFSAEDSLKAVERLTETDIATAVLVLEKTVLTLTAQYFDLRQMWTPPPKQRLQKIKEVDEQLYHLLKDFYGDGVPATERIALAHKIIPLVFSSYAG